MTDYAPTPRTRLHRRPTRATYDRATVHAILDEALVCQLGFVVEGQPFVLPTTFVRDGEELFVHGSAASGMLRSLARGVPVCLSVTLVDGFVLARSAFHHSMNYRSVVVLGTAHEVAEAETKRRLLTKLIEKMSPGRSAQVRGPSEKELGVTSVLALPLVEVSAKVRVGPPIDDAGDMDHPVWAGVIPTALRAGEPLQDGSTVGAVEPPALPIAQR